MNLNLSSAVRSAKSVITANSPVLLVGTAVVGVITTGVLAAKGGYKARGVIDAVREESGEEPTPMEKIKLTWLCYAIPAATGASTIASVLGVHLIHNKRHAALAGLYAVTTAKLDDYADEAEKLLGPKKSQQLNNAVAQKGIDRDSFSDTHEIIITGMGTELMYDEWSGRYFDGSIPVVEQAIAEINIQLSESEKASLNDYWAHVGLPPLDIGHSFGWHVRRIDAKFGSVNTPDGRSAVSVGFHESPTTKRRPA